MVAEIIVEHDLQGDDWVIDVRRADAIKSHPKLSHQQTPVAELEVATLPKDKRLVFTCARISVPDKAITAGFCRVAVLV